MKQLITALIILASASFGAIAQAPAARNAKTAQTASQSVTQAVIKVEGNCGMCKTNIEKAATSVKGVSSAGWDIKTKTLTIGYNPTLTGPDAVSKAIALAGYDAGKYKAAQKTYDALSACCKYRK